MKIARIVLLVVTFVLFELSVPIKTTETGGSCLTSEYINRHNLILSDTPPRTNYTSIDGEGCAPPSNTNWTDRNYDTNYVYRSQPSKSTMLLYGYAINCEDGHQCLVLNDFDFGLLLYVLRYWE